jgi:hypothetical protein
MGLRSKFRGDDTPDDVFQNDTQLANLPITSPIGWRFTDRWSQFEFVGELGMA